MSTIILQNISTVETRTIRTAAMLLDNMHVVNSSLDQLSTHIQLLNDGALPVGSVEFVREAMNLLNIVEPPNLSYPDKLTNFLGRTIKQQQIKDITGRWFVKPTTTKLFNGFIYDSSQNSSILDEHDLEQYTIFKSLPPTTLVWVSEPVRWLAEWRYYVAYNGIVGKGRYDTTGADDAPEPNIHVVRECIKLLDLPYPYAIDVGVLTTGETVLVEVNDAWAIGLYQKAMAPRDYLYFLRTRWRMLIDQRVN